MERFILILSFFWASFCLTEIDAIQILTGKTVAIKMKVVPTVILIGVIVYLIAFYPLVS